MDLGVIVFQEMRLGLCLSVYFRLAISIDVLWGLAYLAEQRDQIICFPTFHVPVIVITATKYINEAPKNPCSSKSLHTIY